MFSNCDSLKTVYGPEVTEVGTYCFWDCDSLETVTMNKLETIRNDAFEGSNLESVSFPSVKTIESSAFRSALKLKTVNIPKVEKIETMAFYDCDLLTSVTFGTTTPPEMSEYGVFAFSGSTKVWNINIPSSSRNIYITALNEANNTNDIFFGTKLPTINGTSI